MGRSYSFECSRCGFRAKVSGRPDRALDFFVQTILCRDCKQLYDAVTRIRWAEELPDGVAGLGSALRRTSLLSPPKSPPTFEAALNRLRLAGLRRYRWTNFPLQCPVSRIHRVQSWNDPDKCPRCGVYLEKNALPYRIWE
jgi:hypothetical protein